jgi:hypothetical protein
LKEFACGGLQKIRLLLKKRCRPSCAGRNHPYAAISPAVSNSAPPPAVILANARIHPRPFGFLACGGQAKVKENHNFIFLPRTRQFSRQDILFLRRQTC